MVWKRYPGNLPVPWLKGSGTLPTRYYTSYDDDGFIVVIQHGSPHVREDPVDIFKGKWISEIRFSYSLCPCLEGETNVRTVLSVISVFIRIGNSRSYVRFGVYWAKFSVDLQTDEWLGQSSISFLYNCVVDPECNSSFDNFVYYDTFTPIISFQEDELKEWLKLLPVCPEEPDDEDTDPEEPDFELECPKPQYIDQSCTNPIASEQWTVNNDGFIVIESPLIIYASRRITYHRVTVEGETYCFSKEDTLGDDYLTEKYKVTTPFRPGQHLPFEPSNYFVEKACQKWRDGESDRDLDERSSDDNLQDGDKPCGLYIILDFSVGIKFTYLKEIPGQEAENVTTVAYKAWSARHYVDTPIQVTNAQMSIANLIQPEVTVELDFQGISLDIGFRLEIANVELSNNRFEFGLSATWVSLFPQFAPALLTLSALPVSPYASVSMAGIGRHDC